MQRIKGPGLFVVQFLGDVAPYDTLDHLAAWAAGLGYVGLQLPTHDPRLIDLSLAAGSDDYCADLLGRLAAHGLSLTELSTHQQGQLVAAHPAYDAQLDSMAPAALRGRSAARTAWATDQLRLAAHASRRLGLAAHATFSGALLWPFLYPWPQRPAGLVEDGFAELARRWRPILDIFDEQGVDCCFEIHPAEDLHDGITFERFLAAVGDHPRANMLYDPSHLLLQHVDHVGFIDVYHERIKAFHVKDAEFRPNARSGVYGGYQAWIDRAGRFRSLGDGMVDFGGVFSALTRHGYPGWAVVEWECALKHPDQGAREGAPFVRRHLIDVTSHPFDDFVGGQPRDPARNRALLGLAPADPT